jgi:hypothetical protein
MNTYTLDPSKSESVAAPVHPSAPAPVPVAAPFYAPPNYQYYPYQYPQLPTAQAHIAQVPFPQAPFAHAPVAQASVVQPDISKIRDWLLWSIINLFTGGLLLGLFPLIFSLLCRSNKRKNNINGARTMSTLALVFNIIITITTIGVLIALFIYLFVYTQQMNINY